MAYSEFFAMAAGYIVFSFFTSRLSMHMLQLNSYRPERYLKWLSENKNKAVCLRALFVIPGVIGAFFGSGAFFLSAALFFIFAPYKMKKAKKPLVYTGRVKRIFFFLTLLELLVSICAFLFIEKAAAASAILCLAAFITPFLVLAADILDMPFEKLIAKRYINDAKKILADMPNLKVIGVTGSYGKTSMKYAVTRLLSEKYSVLMTPGSFNTPMGVVRTIREQLKSTHQIFVVEMGAKNKGDIKEICDIVAPDYGIITSVGPQHLETFKTIENVCDTKFELAEAVAKKGGTMFLNYDNEYIRKKNFTGRKITYGTDKSADFCVSELKYSSNGSKFMLNGKELSTSLLGNYSAVNIAGAFGVAALLGVPEEDLKAAVRQLKAPEHRLKLIKNPRYTVIDDAYNSNPSGAAAALDALSGFAERKILVTPGMVELGDEQDRLNREFGKKAASSADYIVLVGEKQAGPIKEGVLEGGFDPARLYVAKDINDALSYVYKITDVPSVVLLENDLPDNFL